MDKSHIIALFIGSILTLLGAVVANIFSERRDRRKEFNEAAIEFRSAFTEEIKALRHYSRDTVWHIIRPEIIMKHEIAMEKFQFFLNGEKRFHFDMAWQSYSEYKPCQNHEQKEPGYVSGKWDIQEEKRLILCKINTLLSYAKHK